MPANTIVRPASAKAGGAATKRATGGNGLTNDLAKLSIPFGIVLAQNGLRSYLDAQKRTTKSTKKTSGGGALEGSPLEGSPLMLDGGKKKAKSKAKSKAKPKAKK